MKEFRKTRRVPRQNPVSPAPQPRQPLRNSVRLKDYTTLFWSLLTFFKHPLLNFSSYSVISCVPENNRRNRFTQSLHLHHFTHSSPGCLSPQKTKVLHVFLWADNGLPQSFAAQMTAPSEREPFGGESNQSLPLRRRWLGVAETEGVRIPQAAVKRPFFRQYSTPG